MRKMFLIIAAVVALICLGVLCCLAYQLFTDDGVGHDHNQTVKLMQLAAVVFIGACSVSVQLVTQEIFAENKARDNDSKARDDHKKIIDIIDSWNKNFEWMHDGFSVEQLNSLKTILDEIYDSIDDFGLRITRSKITGEKLHSPEEHGVFREKILNRDKEKNRICMALRNDFSALCRRIKSAKRIAKDVYEHEFNYKDEKGNFLVDLAEKTIINAVNRLHVHVYNDRDKEIGIDVPTQLLENKECIKGVINEIDRDIAMLNIYLSNWYLSYAPPFR